MPNHEIAMLKQKKVVKKKSCGCHFIEDAITQTCTVYASNKRSCWKQQSLISKQITKSEFSRSSLEVDRSIASSMRLFE